jgi:hypothetical protein
MTRRSRLDDPAYSGFAWSRYWRLMRWMVSFTLAVTVLMLAIFYHQYGLISIHFYIATAGAIIISLLLASSLMGLVFLSSGSGHDESIEDPFADEVDRDG